VHRPLGQGREDERPNLAATDLPAAAAAQPVEPFGMLTAAVTGVPSPIPVVHPVMGGVDE
jgi:hypothetical protein